MAFSRQSNFGADRMPSFAPREKRRATRSRRSASPAAPGSSRSDGRCAVVDDPALVHAPRCASENSSATRLFCSTSTMDSSLSPRSRSSTAVQRLDDHRREALGRLVHQQHGRIGQQRARDRQHLLLAAGELVAHVGEPLLQIRETARTRAPASSGRARAPTSRFSRTDSDGKISRSCGTKPRPASARR